MSASLPTQIVLRVGGLLITLVMLFIAAMIGFHVVERRGVAEGVASLTAERGRLLDALLSGTDQPLRLFVASYARRTSFTRPQTPPRGGSAESTLRAGLRTFDLEAAWVLEADGRVRLYETTTQSAELAAPPVTGAQLPPLPTDTLSFSMERDGALFRVRGARLAPDPTHPNAERGWLLAAKRWDPDVLATPALLIEGRMALVAPSAAGAPPSERFPIRVERVLRDVNRQPLRVLQVDLRPDEVDIAVFNAWLATLVVVAFGIAALGVLIFCITRWVILPATSIQRILAERDLKALEPLRRRGGYLARMADLVHQLLTAEDRLKELLAERTRLGRELHDGTIQSIYASGMGIASARAILRQNPAGAERLLDDARQELNATIVNVRDFIGILEPEAGRKQTLEKAVRVISTLFSSAGDVRFDLQIDDAVAATLTPFQHLHVLQILREAISNAVRHGESSCITVSLRREGQDIAIEVADDGRGLDQRSAREGGNGLANIQARASELGGTVVIEANASGGVSVRLRLPHAAKGAAGEPASDGISE